MAEESKEKQERKMKEESKEKKNTEKEVAKTSCSDITCPVHGKLKARGRTFKGYVVKKHPRRIAIAFERIIYVRKYERYMKKKTRIHARLPSCQQDKVKIGDYVIIRECRPLSKIIHFVFLRKVKEEGRAVSEEKKINEETGREGK